MTNKKQIGVKTEAYNKLKIFVSSRKYVSLRQINPFLKDIGYNYSRVTIQKYIQQLKKEEILYSAGRGYYSTNKKHFPINYDEFRGIIDLIKEKYPLLEFTLWSTKMLAPLFHHTQNQFYTFIYTDFDSMPMLNDYLLQNNYSSLLNPSINEKNIALKNNSIIVRPTITRSKSENHISVIEKIIVDLFIESNRLNLIDFSEYQRILEALLNSYRINISYLLDYSERRKIDRKIREMIEKYTNATFFN
jgi:biotin operon repressor